MPKPQLPLFGLMVVLVSFLSSEPCFAAVRNKDCGFTMCGNLNISYPFRLKSQSSECGNKQLELDCENNNRTTLATKYEKFYVQEIVYDISTFRVVYESLGMEGNCSLPLTRFYHDSFFCGRYINPNMYFYPVWYYLESFRDIYSVMYLLNCSTPVNSSLYVEASRCTNSSSRPPSAYFYFIDRETLPSDFNEACTVIATVPIKAKNITILSTSEIYQKLLLGFEFSWSSVWRREFKDYCTNRLSFSQIMAKIRDALVDYYNSFTYFIIHRPLISAFNGFPAETDRTYIMCLGITGGIVLIRALPGIFCLIVVVVYKWRRRHLSADDTIEEFLQHQKDLMPIRYSYREIERMTRGFKDKLGEGGYGSVFKGKLRSGYFVAIKLLGKSKGKGDDFINEVATIGRIHHVNVAKLIGFCVEGQKQALVYDFMPNGSLDKILFAKESITTLTWQKMFDIALGVARGIEYLHQGCDMQILHFDIKPHNILLDENFIPKVADFGLAKLYSVDDSIVSLTAARGTIGYIAPELIYKSLGGVSYKADVYSFGMLLMEIVGRRKNMNTSVEHKSQTYFPSWIYDRYYQGGDMELGDVTDDERKIMRRMVIIASWCIQVKPDDRPSMSKVLEMFESDVEFLQMPSKPFQLPFEVSTEDPSYVTSSGVTSSTLLDSSNTISLSIM